MKLIALAAACAAMTFASAQTIFVGEAPVNSFGPTYRYGWHPTDHPHIICLGNPNWVPTTRQNNLPFAYGSFFYGMSWNDWMRSREPTPRHGWRW